VKCNFRYRFLWKEQTTPPVGVSGGAVSSPSKAKAAERFSRILEAPNGHYYIELNFTEF